MSNWDESFDSMKIEKWLETYFLDPLTSYLDQHTFRIDIYETEEDYILEALLSEFTISSITVFLNGCQISISVDHEGKNTSRSVVFPNKVTGQSVSATFSNGILEVFIPKYKMVPTNRNRYINVKYKK